MNGFEEKLKLKKLYKEVEMRKTLLIVILLLFIATIASARDIGFTLDTADEITQDQFDKFIKELGMALTFNPMAPAEPLGITGFDVSAEIVASDISDDKDYWKKLVGDDSPFAYLPVPRLHVQKGLPFNFDIGAMYVAVPDSNVKLWGIELKYAILEGTAATPALCVRGSYSSLTGVDDIDLNTIAADVLISKGFLMVTPYGGLSIVRIAGSENSDYVTLDDVNETCFRGIVGVQFSPFPLFVINGEVSYGEIMQYGLKIGVRF